MTSTASSRRVHVRAPGKINVFFEVGDVQDDGYHDVASVYQAVSAYEDVYASHADGFTIEVEGVVDVSGVPVDDRNLAVRAARLLAGEIGYDGGVHLEVRKAVPVAGGMGGGSADAAAALVACDALWGAGLSPAHLQRLATRLGADVPFALMGGTAVGTGRGDQLSPALARGRMDWVIVATPMGMSTPDVYRELDRLRDGAGAPDIAPPPSVPDVDPAVLQALRTGDAAAVAAVVHNDLQEAAFSLRPELAQLRELGMSQGALAGMVSGSGPTVAFLTADPTAAMELRVNLAAAGHDALTVHGPVAGARVVG
ncbi:4-(cytidine 5'-diphospho)-2-C-methyl-D-erythritol kinase [Microbacterium sp. zg.Y1090]|uniref:4-(cytidine 5'-diphospho)-2-C-methyl-D-erythritol kinase n=1 Tax=Microbacterium TaxID=33882 RepID=UPI00214D12B7|nr:MULTISPECIES: 4-(cytidine 5'-diphospho)-2-C-methyl-D-erythritol kinase [unclassified Microbacterium]MCR2812221.1 4-(cytidine 5'-diphospho)-2-C-methyl-D-erythritol kinase [Microbacterium sp. zg.Y1084]MCR2818341.1 4-(cytidine 5'-diphospho)-2-C-methyl-D-erythritol kinase [Microbacterium sp. zg.Y1090]MDL5486153.1 4-(cytidine 5'-diphospho)-2-C-methyl-D-erythritol kinase [Microbacterium sp. zg-Y1211]WIM29361.1 4-(cytidine 5'-diphospho)-2-C-methyl-D-erythritol kinase [Microbacterium sp. zg-Y1090]